MDGNKDGYTLAELIMGIFMISVIAAPILSIMVSSKMTAVKTQQRAAATAAVRRVSEALKAYVTADTSLANGPGVGPNGWSLPGDQSGLYALGAGHHPLDVSQWAPSLTPYQGTLSYDVTVRMTPSGRQPDVSFSVGWQDQ